MRIVVIGGGHNGLVAAASLARGGHSVTVLENRERLGGVADGLLHDSETLSPEVIAELNLTDYGLKLTEPTPVFVPQSEGRGLLLHRSTERGQDELGEDAGAYREWRQFLDRVLPFARTQLTQAALDIRQAAPLWPLAKAGLAFRRLGKEDIHELLRVGPTCVDDYLSEWFKNPALKAALAGPALHGTFMGSRSPSSTATLLLHEAQVSQEVVGGPGALVDVLQKACTSSNVSLELGAGVCRIQTEAGKVTAVELDGGRTVEADLVVSCIGPKRTLLGMVEPTALPVGIADKLSKVRLRGTLARVDLELSEPIDYSCRPGLHPARSFLAEDPLDLERAFDHVKHRRMPTDPPLDIRQSAGHASVLVRCASIELEGGWKDERRRELGQAVLSSLARFAPDTRSTASITGIQTPQDLAEEYSLEGGHEMHGELSLDQLGPMRPTLELSRFETPIQGLVCGSSGVHPGGAISGLPGLLAARAALG